MSAPRCGPPCQSLSFTSIASLIVPGLGYCPYASFASLEGLNPAMPMSLRVAGRRGTSWMSGRDGKVKFKRPHPPELFWVVFGYIWKPAILVGSSVLPRTPKLQDFWIGPRSCDWDRFSNDKSHSCSSARLIRCILNTVQGGKVAFSCGCQAPGTTHRWADPHLLPCVALQVAILLHPVSQHSWPGAAHCGNSRQSAF